MDILKLVFIFTLIVAIIKLKKPLHISVLLGSIATILLYGINFTEIIQALRYGILGSSTVNLVLAFYTITFLQRMLEKRNHLILAEQSLTNLFNSRRVNAMVAPFVIGLLPSPGAVLIAAPIVDKAAEDSLDLEERTFVTSFFRHISEAFVPTYATILLALNLSGIDMTQFVIFMVPMAILLFILGYVFYVKKIPAMKNKLDGIDKKKEIKNLITSLWTILLTILVILVFKIPVYVGAISVIVLSFFINRFSVKEIKPMFYTAFEKRLILTTIAIMVFKELLTISGVIERLPSYFSGLPISPVIVFGIIFFWGTLIAGAQAMIALALPLAFATITDGGLALLIFIMCMTYIAMQISPTHICLAIITENNEIPFTSLVVKTMPVLVTFIVLSSLYSYLLYMLI